MASDSAAAYKSNSQQARVVTETWGADNLYCPNCSAPKLDRLSHNTRASDFSCPKCRFWFQLKGQQSRIGNSVADGAYAAMMNAIRNDETPNFYFMHYDVATWRIRNLLLVPHFAFPPSAIIKRKPLAVTARRAGWVGCNIALHRVPADARIEIIKTCSSGHESAPSSSGNQSRLTSAATIVTPAKEVRDRFKRIKPLGEIKAKERGWTLDVLNAVRRLGKIEFTTNDAYSFTSELEALHPDNRHVRDKIRQQLQVLRDMRLLIHVERGVWRLP
jgi:type II restriction enzyme